MFCPNCGTQNDSAATPCKKCGFKLSGVSMPKFKGTMMLNSDQTVQERIEEHRRKQAPGGAAEKSKGQASEPAPKKVPGSSAPPSSLGSPRGPVLQPPRVAASTRGRMGGTMMGVAPQAGGVLPPRGAAPVRPVARDPGYPEEPAQEARALGDAASVTALGSEAVAGGFEPSHPNAGPADALAGTLAIPSIPPAPEPPLDAVGVPSPSESGRHVARTQPLAAVPNPEERPASDTGEFEPAETGVEGAADPELRATDTRPPRNRAVAATAALPRQSEPPVAGPTGQSEPVPAGIRPLDVVLIVCTLGVYGVVLWFRQRKRPA